MLRFLTDSHVPPAIATAVRRVAEVPIVPLRDWQEGHYLHASDHSLLEAAWAERRTIVTYDVRTFPVALKERLGRGDSHSGVVFVSARFGQNDVGKIAHALVDLWSNRQNEDWTNVIYFL